MSAAGHPVTLARQLAAVAREVTMRRKCYPKWVARGSMDAAEAEAELRAMEAAQATLTRLLAQEQHQASLFAERYCPAPAPALGGRG